MLFQRVAFALGGFYAGGYLALVAAERFFPGAVGVGEPRRFHASRRALVGRTYCRHGGVA